VLRSARISFVVALWLLALWPLAMLALGLADPEAGVRVAHFADRGVGWLLWAVAIAAGAATLLYPPFVPALRLQLRAVRARLSRDDKALRDAHARLTQFETVNDLHLVGRALRDTGFAKEAVPRLRRALELDPQHMSARYQLALALRDAGEAQAAVDALQQLINTDPAYASGQPFLDLAEICAQARAYPQADLVLTEYRRRHGDNRLALLLHAKVLASLGQAEQSRTALQTAAQPQKPGARLSAEENLARARARVALWFGGYR
jgi:tetratricopeptide (TPR) repeat protein